LGDLVRATFLVKNPSDTETIAKKLGEHFEIVMEPWKKTDVGYTDRAINVRFKNGLQGEVLMMTKEMQDAKDGPGQGHVMYKNEQKAEREGNRAQMMYYRAQQIALYGSVLASYPLVWKAALGIAGNLPNVS